MSKNTLTTIDLLQTVCMAVDDHLADLMEQEQLAYNVIIELEDEIYAQKILYLCRTGRYYE